MAALVRPPLPNRRELQTLTGLIQAVRYHLNVNNITVTDDSALGYINAAEDIDLTPLKTFFMKRAEVITLDTDGRYRIRDLQFPMTELIGLYYSYADMFNQRVYLQYVDPVTFGQGYAASFAQATYTIMTDDDGSNDQIIQVYPAPPEAEIGIEYYCDWAKLGDLTTNSRLQQISIATTGSANANATIAFQTGITNGNLMQAISTLNITTGATANGINNVIANANVFNLMYEGNLPGNNITYWQNVPYGNGNIAVFTSPTFTSNIANITITPNANVGLTFTLANVTTPFIQTVQTNWLLYNFPYLYYYAALKHAYNGLADQDRYQFVEKEFIKAVQVFQQFTDRAEFAGANQQSDYNQNVNW